MDSNSLIVCLHLYHMHAHSVFTIFNVFISYHARLHSLKSFYTIITIVIHYRPDGVWGVWVGRWWWRWPPSVAGGRWPVGRAPRPTAAWAAPQPWAAWAAPQPKDCSAESAV